MIDRILQQTHFTRLPSFFDGIVWLCWCAIIYWLSDQPSLPAPMWFPHQDKLYHGIFYFVLALLSWRSCRHYIADTQAQYLAALLFGSLYGISDEWHQSFVPGRSSTAADWLADTVGAALAMAGLWWWWKRHQR